MFVDKLATSFVLYIAQMILIVEKNDWYGYVEFLVFLLGFAVVFFL